MGSGSPDTSTVERHAQPVPLGSTNFLTVVSHTILFRDERRRVQWECCQRQVAPARPPAAPFTSPAPAPATSAAMAPRNTSSDAGALDGDREDRDMVIPPIPSDDDRSKDPAVRGRRRRCRRRGRRALVALACRSCHGQAAGRAGCIVARAAGCWRGGRALPPRRGASAAAPPPPAPLPQPHVRLPPPAAGRRPQVWDLVVVGAGVAGAAFAYQQGREGRRVLLLERDLSQPDRIIGELLQVGTGP